MLVVFKNGEKVRERWDGRDRWKLFTYNRASEADYAIVDPDGILLLDVNKTNNSKAMKPQANEAATKWMYRWMMWLQDLLVTYTFFV